MIKQSIKNYFKCLKYVFTPLGIIALGLALGLSVAIPGIMGAISDMCKRILDISGKTIDFDALIANIVTAVEALDWSDPLAALGTMFTKNWFYDTIINNINPIVGDIETYMKQIGAAVNDCIGQIIAYAVVVGIFVILAFLASCFLTKWMIRRDIARRTVKQFVISTLIGSVLAVLFLCLMIWLAFLWRYSVIITAIVAFLSVALYSLLNAYITYGRKNVPIKSVVNIKNASWLALSDLIIFAIAIVITVIITLITNLIVGLFVCIGLLIVTASVMGLTADAYVKGLADAKHNSESTDNAEQPIQNE